MMETTLQRDRLCHITFSSVLAVVPAAGVAAPDKTFVLLRDNLCAGGIPSLSFTDVRCRAVPSDASSAPTMVTATPSELGVTDC